MHVIVLLIMVFFTHNAGDDKPPVTQVLRAPDGITIEQCKAHGKELGDILRGREGVADVEVGCLDFVVKAAI